MSWWYLGKILMMFMIDSFFIGNRFFKFCVDMVGLLIFRNMVLWFSDFSFFINGLFRLLFEGLFVIRKYFMDLF